jgi:hypothetical protein
MKATIIEGCGARGGRPVSRTFLAAVMLALVAVPAARASNMMFKAERELVKIEGSQSYYYISFPFFRSSGDLWNTQEARLDPGPGGDDGVLSDDVLADWYTNGDGSCEPGECEGIVSLLRFNRGTNQWEGQTILRNPFTLEIEITGAPFDVDDDPPEGHLAQVVEGEFQVEIVGSENPFVLDWHLVTEPGKANYYPFSLPYHTIWQTSDDLLDAAWEGRDDSQCFTLVVARFDNATNEHIERKVEDDDCPDCLAGATCQPVFSGTAFPLDPPEGYRLQIEKGSTWLPIPHY